MPTGACQCGEGRTGRVGIGGYVAVAGGAGAGSDHEEYLHLADNLVGLSPARSPWSSGYPAPSTVHGAAPHRTRAPRNERSASCADRRPDVYVNHPVMALGSTEWIPTTLAQQRSAGRFPRNRPGSAPPVKVQVFLTGTSGDEMTPDPLGGGSERGPLALGCVRPVPPPAGGGTGAGRRLGAAPGPYCGSPRPGRGSGPESPTHPDPPVRAEDGHRGTVRATAGRERPGPPRAHGGSVRRRRGAGERGPSPGPGRTWSTRGPHMSGSAE